MHSRDAVGKWVDDAVARFQRPLISYAARLLNHDIESARDVVQDAFVKLCSQDRMTVQPKLAEWLFAVVRNRSIDVYRKENRMRLIERREINRRDAEPTGSIDPATIVQTNGDAKEIIALLDALPANQAEVIRLKFQHGLSYQEIAGVTKLSVSNVGYLIHTGIKTLREKLKIDVEKKRSSS